MFFGKEFRIWDVYLGVWQTKNMATVEMRTRDMLMSFDCWLYPLGLPRIWYGNSTSKDASTFSTWECAAEFLICHSCFQSSDVGQYLEVEEEQDSKWDDTCERHVMRGRTLCPDLSGGSTSRTGSKWCTSCWVSTWWGECNSWTTHLNFILWLREAVKVEKKVW